MEPYQSKRSGFFSIETITVAGLQQFLYSILTGKTIENGCTNLYENCLSSACHLLVKMTGSKRKKAVKNRSSKKEKVL